MTRQEAEKLVDELMQAAFAYENGEGSNVEYYRQMKERVVLALTTTEERRDIGEKTWAQKHPWGGAMPRYIYPDDEKKVSRFSLTRIWQSLRERGELED